MAQVGGSASMVPPLQIINFHLPFTFGPDSHDQNPPDMIIRSCDGVDFYVHKLILAFSSPFFRNMLAFPEPTGENANPTKNGIPIVTLPEPGEVLQIVLGLIYPRQAPVPTTSHWQWRYLHFFLDAYEAARKYDVASGEEILSSILDEPHWLEEEPLVVYKIACRIGQTKTARKAALETLKTPRTAAPSWQLRDLTGQQLWKLYDFQYRAAEGLQRSLGLYILGESLENLGYSDPRFVHVWWTPDAHSEFCGPIEEGDWNNPETMTIYPTRWFQEHIARIQELCLIRPSPAWIAKRLLELSASALDDVSHCPRCMDKAAGHLGEMAELFETKGRQRIAEIVEQYDFTTSK
ncbi:hypothetical protein C8F01DRAFT_1362294 [Mycena amicta]|nr:hypothetical protein C8F01DRAFT_1362294 [Mycena amicta]